MFAKRSILASALGVALLMGLQVASYASNPQSASVAGGITLDGISPIGISGSITRYTIGTYVRTCGSIVINGKSGGVGLNFSGTVSAATFSTYTAGGVTYNSVAATIDPSGYMNTITGASCQAIGYLYMTTGSNGSKTLAFQIANTAGTTVLAQAGTFPAGTIGVAPTALLALCGGTESITP
jgi:hypothetical protein